MLTYRRAPSFRFIPLLALLLLLCAGTGGCGLRPELVRAPNLYTESDAQPYADVPEEWRNNLANVVYATDRSPLNDRGLYSYTSGRSRVISYGLCTVQMGKAEATWDELVAASTKLPRKGDWPLNVIHIDEQGFLPAQTPPVEVDGTWVDDPQWRAEANERAEQLQQIVAAQLAKTPTKELYVFVHGYNNTFEWGAARAALIWHYMGRRGVPVMFSWPAGSGGLLRGYTRDRESGEFSTVHLKRFLRALAACPDVKKINVIGHSRGTDILTSTIRELHLEYRGAGKDTRKELKLGQMVLAAPDIDLDVFIEKFSADYIGHVPEQLTVYVSDNDKAIGIASWLFSSFERIGTLRSRDLTPEAFAAAKNHPTLALVDVKAKTGRGGHDYFMTSPAVLSDLIMVLRDDRRPGAANGRPLTDNPSGFWELNNGYPFLDQPTTQPK